MLMLSPEPKEWLEEDSSWCLLFTVASAASYLDIGNGSEKTTAKKKKSSLSAGLVSAATTAPNGLERTDKESHRDR
jgi:hypothetical protein